MRIAVALALFALGACSTASGGGLVVDDGGSSDVGAPAQDEDAAVRGTRVDAATDPDAGIWTYPDASVGGGTDATTTTGSLKVKWGKGCWENQNGQRFQAISFDLTTTDPVALEATLFFTPKCDNSNGTENFNDVGATITSGSYAYWFVHHPDEMSTSAIWSIGNDSTGCIDYQHAQDCR